MSFLAWKLLLQSHLLFYFLVSPLFSDWSGGGEFSHSHGDPKIFVDIKSQKFEYLSPVSTCKFAAVLKFENVEDLNPTQWFF